MQRHDGRSFEAEPEVHALNAPPRHGAELLPAIDARMRAAELEWSDLDGIAVGTGPGTFTGLRIGIATARGLAQATGLPLRAVSSLAALAAGVDAQVVVAVIDARRGEVFAAAHAGGEAVWEPFVATPATLAERLRSAADQWPSTPVAVGDGSLRSRDILEAVGVDVPPDGSQVHALRALHVCRLAGAAPAVPPEAVVPTYLRAPDARPRDDRPA